MDLISELAYILNKRPSGEFEAFLPLNSKVRKLYDLVVTDGIRKDEDAAKLMYNAKKNDKRYLMLKRNLIQKLSDLVYISGNSGEFEDNHVNLIFALKKDLNIAEKLLQENVYHNATKIINRVEQTAEKYFLVDIQLEAAQMFRSVYSLKGYPDNTITYDEKLAALRKFQNYYSASRGMWEIMYSKIKYSNAKTPDLIAESTLMSGKIEGWTKLYKSPFLRLYLYRINIILYNQENNFEAGYKNIKLFEHLIQEFPYINSKAVQLEIEFAYAEYYRNTRKLNKAIYHLKKCENITEYAAFNRFMVDELMFDIFMKTAEYEKALSILRQLRYVPQFQFLDPKDQSAWFIRQAFLYFVFKLENKSDLIAQLPDYEENIDLNKFLELTKPSSKDKLGYNIMLLTIRLILLMEKNYKEIDYEGNNLSIYYHRYLKKLNSERTRIFFKFLAKMASQAFSEDVIDSALENIQKAPSDVFDVFELISYDELISMLRNYWKKMNAN